MPSPRDLDPKFEDAKPKIDSYEPETDNIVYRQIIVNPDGTPGEKLHGPMPRSEWAAYEKENGL